MASCLKAMIANEDTPAHETDEEILKSLSEGIKDGLLRMLLQFHLGYPVSDEGNDQSDIVQSYFKNIYSSSANFSDMNESKKSCVKKSVERSKIM